jgi:hypothetical protein
MVRRMIAGAAAVGVLTLGASGVAGAATATTPTAPSSGSTTTTTPVTRSCADLAQLLKHHQASEQKAGARLHKLAATENRLRRFGHSKLAGMMAKRVHSAQSREKRITARLHKAVRACAGASGSGSSKSSGSKTSSGSSKTSGSSTSSTASVGG